MPSLPHFRRPFSVFAAAAIVLAALAMSACSSSRDRSEQPYIEGSVEDLYNRGMDELLDRDYRAAKALFDEVERQHPYSVWATKAQLMSAYASFQNSDYDDAIVSLDRFIQLHPGNPDAVYAHYLKALSYYEQIVDVERDQHATVRALEALDEVVRRYPDTDYARDARLKADLARDHLAGKEMSIGRFYLRRGNLLAAINRFRNVVEEYETTSHAPEALHRLTEAYMALGMTTEARRTAAVLGYNYPGSEWYADSYAMLEGVEVAMEPPEEDEGGILTATTGWVGSLFEPTYRVGSISPGAMETARRLDTEAVTAMAPQPAEDEDTDRSGPRTRRIAPDTAETPSPDGDAAAERRRLIEELRALRGDAEPASAPDRPAPAAVDVPGFGDPAGDGTTTAPALTEVAPPREPTRPAAAPSRAMQFEISRPGTRAAPDAEEDTSPVPPPGMGEPATARPTESSSTPSGSSQFEISRPGTRAAPDAEEDTSPVPPPGMGEPATARPTESPGSPQFEVGNPDGSTRERGSAPSGESGGSAQEGDAALAMSAPMTAGRAGGAGMPDAGSPPTADRQADGFAATRPNEAGIEDARRKLAAARQAHDGWAVAAETADSPEGQRRARLQAEAASTAVRVWEARLAVMEATTESDRASAEREAARRSVEYWEAAVAASEDPAVRSHAEGNLERARRALARHEGQGGSAGEGDGGNAGEAEGRGWLSRTFGSLF